MRFRTDAEAVYDDVAALLTAGRFNDALVPAALQADRFGVLPPSITFLAEIVRRGGIRYAAELPEPLPTPEQTILIRRWLLTSNDDDRMARWLDGVAALIEARRLSGR
ncbi:hypothetical protein [Paractinoplanes durhamensis]|uniref:LysR substrate-binding domain-containing protein n=1 Tax=Paractinoplanes durhamensis TaxID=113563 RepID=A0ABQ3YV99_9ACTN|nr:hypothetical protein [Actinoplanes durhamensis]GIE01517.1 hypothetical protein Adu01nite_28670 [Actinoplanes durhamensis]